MNIAKVTPESFDAIVADAARILKSGGVIVLPTDTVYGLASHPDFPNALRRIYEIKGRDFNKPIAFLADDCETPARYGAKMSAAAKTFADKFWPGSLTLVLDCNGTTEGFRVPDSDFTRAVIAACGGLLRVTSANISGYKPATEVDESIDAVGRLCDLVIDNGKSPIGISSTVIRDNGADWKIIREGGVTEADLKSALTHT